MAAFLGLIMALPAMIGVVYVAVLAVLIASYPAIRGHQLLQIYNARDASTRGPPPPGTRPPGTPASLESR